MLFHYLTEKEIKEEEISDLIDAFKTMSARLEHLEEMRSELLAGVSHDLKTPVTSISGLLQAVNEDVVTGDEAKEFIEISLKETSTTPANDRISTQLQFVCSKRYSQFIQLKHKYIPLFRKYLTSGLRHYLTVN